MRDASALVIGVDRYLVRDIPVLTGCVLDAQRAVDWLLLIGVPKDRIALHLSPAQPIAEPDYRGVPILPALRDDIAVSMNHLAKGRGDELFVFMSGHGLYVTTEGPIFLPADYGHNGLSGKNLRIDEYLRWFLSWPYRDQFVFYDACQSATASIGQVGLLRGQGPDLPAQSYEPSALNGLTACFSCSALQEAWAGDGRGLLARHVLDELNPALLSVLDGDAQQQAAVLYDWSSGARRFDLKTLFDDIIGPAIRLTAAGHQHAQTPFCQAYSRALKDDASPIALTDDEATTEIKVSVEPPAAIDAIKQIRLSVETPPRSLFLNPKTGKLVLPFPGRGPTGASLEARCTPRPDSGWRAVNSPQRHQLADVPVEIVLHLDQPPPAPPGPPDPKDMFNVVVGPSGGGSRIPRGVDIFTSGALKGWTPGGLPKGVDLSFGESVANIGFDVLESSAFKAARGVASSLQKHLRSVFADRDAQVIIARPGEEPDQASPNLRFVLPSSGAEGLGGFLTGEPSVSITALGAAEPQQRLSLDEIAAHPLDRLEPGAYRIRLDLPWGGWSRLIRIPDANETVDCVLPERVGLEPVRNIKLRQGPARAVLRDRWSLDPDIAPGSPASHLPLLATTDETVVRVEPLSNNPWPEWDLLFSAGQLGDFDAERIAGVRARIAERDGDIDHALMSLALAYAAEANQAWSDFWSLLETVRAQADVRPAAELDIALLMLSEAFHTDRTGVEAAGHIMLDEAERRGQRPLLRWAAPLMQQLTVRLERPAPGWVTSVGSGSVVSTVASDRHDPYAVRVVRYDAASGSSRHDIEAIAAEAEAVEAVEAKAEEY